MADTIKTLQDEYAELCKANAKIAELLEKEIIKGLASFGPSYEKDEGFIEAVRSIYGNKTGGIDVYISTLKTKSRQQEYNVRKDN